jgi:hypothetical protein
MAEPLQRIAFSYAPNDVTIFGAGWKYVGDCIFVPHAFGSFRLKQVKQKRSLTAVFPRVFEFDLE